MKMVVETGVVFPGIYSENFGLDVADYYPTLADPLYVNGRAQQIVAIAREIQPDYLIIAEEPDTEAEITGKASIATLKGFSSMVDTFLSQLNSAGFTGTNVGAGVGNLALRRAGLHRSARRQEPPELHRPARLSHQSLLSQRHHHADRPGANRRVSP